MQEGKRWPAHLDSVVEEFQGCFDAMERYELLFEYSKRHPTPLPVEEWTDANQVHGCQSRAHVICLVDEEGGFILRGGAAMAINGMKPAEVAEMEPEYADAMGIRSSLTPSRANGFLNMFKRVREEAALLL